MKHDNFHGDNFFSVRLFYQAAKQAVEENASLPVQQIYETQRVKERANSDTVFPDFDDVKSTLKRIKTKKSYKTIYNTITY